MKIGNELRKARIDAGMTQEAVSKAAGIHRVYLSELERDEKVPTVDVFVRVCRAVKVKPSVVMARIE